MGQYAAVCVLMCMMIVSTVGTQDCKSTINRYDNEDKTVTVCCNVTCGPGYFVDVCKVNGTADRCERCPEGTYLDYSTNSESLEKCTAYDCPPESIPASTFPQESLCGKKCVCDVQRQFVGTDPCTCRRATVTCIRGTSLTINNTCEPIEKEVMTTTTYGPSSTGYFVTTQEENPEYRILTEETVNPNVTVSSYNPGPKGDNNLVTILVPVLLVILFVVMAIAVGVLWYKKRKESTIEVNGETGTNEEPENISLMPHNTTHPTRMEYNASHMVGNGSVNSYKRETEMDAKKNHQFYQNGNTSTDEELENNSLKSLSTSPARTESINASHSFGNGSVNSYTCSRIYTGRDAKENYQFDFDSVELGYAKTLSLGSLNKDKEPHSYDLEPGEPLSKPE